MRRHGKSLPVVWFVTDPERTPDPVAIAGRLPRGTGMIFRHFSRPGAQTMAQELAQVAKGRGLVLLIGADPALAARVGADGVHLPERYASSARRLKARHPGWLVTAAAHSGAAVRSSFRAGADAVLLSAIFPSPRPSAGRSIGPVRLSRLLREAGGPVYALGGVDATTAVRLAGTGVAGFAAIEAFAGDSAQAPIRT